MKFLPSLRITIIALFASAGPVWAGTVYGTLSNFDIYNDSGYPAYGFEIELDGLTPADVPYWFTYNRYGTPQVVPFSGGTYVRWAASYAAGAYSQSTPMAPAIIPTGGHSCVLGSANYSTDGCEHFGVSTLGNATNTVYRWLIDPALSGHLSSPGTNVTIPAATWTVNPVPAQAPVVLAKIVAPPPEQAGAMFGVAQWVKAFVSEKPGLAQLDHLVAGDPLVPDEAAEVEIEWFLFQAGLPDGDQLELGGQVGAGTEAVVRHYEFYKYMGGYDAESHEAIPRPQVACGGGTCPDPLDIGNYIGAQNTALNLAETPEPGTLLLVGAALGAISRLRRKR